MDEHANEKMEKSIPSGEKDEQQFHVFFKKYGQAILIGLGLAVVAFLGYAVFKNYKQSSHARAAQALFTATSPEQLQQIVSQYGSSPAAPLALIMSASMAYQAGQYEMAQYSFSQFRQRYPDHLFAPTASMGIAQCLEALGQFDQALSSYEAFLAANSTHYLAPSAILSRGRCLEEMGRFDEAKIVYEDFIAANPDSAWASQAESAILFVDMKRRAGERETAVATEAPPSGEAAPVITLPAP